MGTDPRCFNMKKIFHTQRLYIQFALSCIITGITLFIFFFFKYGNKGQASYFPLVLVLFVFPDPAFKGVFILQEH